MATKISKLRVKDMSDLTGGCLCGKVRYKATADPTFTGVCHCSACQRFTGSAFAILVAFLKTDLEIRGQLKNFASDGDSGKKLVRNFCSECGSGVYEEAEIHPESLLVCGGTLDDPAAVTPILESFCDNKLHWAILDDAMQKFSGRPS